MKLYKISNTELSVYEFNLKEVLNLSELTKNTVAYLDSSNAAHHPTHHHIVSSGYFAHKTSNIFDSLIEETEKRANEIANHLIGDMLVKAKFKVRESWAMKYKKFGYVNNHNHYPYGYSAVFYMLAESTSSIWFNSTEIKTMTGQLLIFHGSLYHMVKPVTPKHTERIVFAMNLYPEFDYSALEETSNHVEKTKQNSFIFS